MKVNSLHIVEFKESNPKMALRKIGEIFGISGERVRQICSVYHVETKRIVSSHPCKSCGLSIVGQLSKKFCSEDCWFHYLYMSLMCDTCYQVFFRRRTVVLKQVDDVRYKGRNYCSRECSAKGMSKTMVAIFKGREL